MTSKRRGVSAPMDIKALMSEMNTRPPSVVVGDDSNLKEPAAPIPEQGRAATAEPAPAAESIVSLAMEAPREPVAKPRAVRQTAPSAKPVFVESGNPAVIKQFQLRLREPLKNRLDWVSKHLVHVSAHEFIVQAIEARLNEELARASSDGS